MPARRPAILLDWNDHRATSLIRYAGLASQYERRGCARIDKDVSERGLETIKLVGQERVIIWDSPVLIKHSHPSIGASQDYGVSRVAVSV